MSRNRKTRSTPSTSDTIRAFLAVSLSSNDRRQLERIALRLRPLGGNSMRIIPEQNVHLTLVFLGNVANDQIRQLRSTLTATAMPPATHLLFDRLGLLPNPRHPSVLVVEPAESETSHIEQVRRIYEVASTASASIDVQPERRRFRPHVTIARFRRGGRVPRRLSEEVSEPLEPSVILQIERLALYRSLLDSTGASYEVLDEWTLKQGDQTSTQSL